MLDAALRDDVVPEQIQDRVLNDGSTHRVFKRFFAASQLAGELGGGRPLFEGRRFVMVEARALGVQPAIEVTTEGITTSPVAPDFNARSASVTRSCSSTSCAIEKLLACCW